MIFDIMNGCRIFFVLLNILNSSIYARHVCLKLDVSYECVEDGSDAENWGFRKSF